MKAYELLGSPDKWTRGAFARNKDNVGYTSVVALGACKFCAAGAVIKCHGALSDELKRLRRTIKERYDRTIYFWNDDMATHEEVVALLKELDI